jgi:hypothetical protein
MISEELREGDSRISREHRAAHLRDGTPLLIPARSDHRIGYR